MTAGLPSTGLGGIFYFLLAAFMPMRELWVSLCGRGVIGRWKQIFMTLFLTTMILLALWLEAWLLIKIFIWSEHYLKSDNQIVYTAAIICWNIAPAIILAPFIVLAVMIVSIHFLRVIIWFKRRVSSVKAHSFISDDKVDILSYPRQKEYAELPKEMFPQAPKVSSGG